MKFPKSTIWATAIVTGGFIANLESQTEARSPSESSSMKIVTGEVFKVEGEFQMSKDRQGDDTLDIVDESYLITDQTGKEVRLELDDNTKIMKMVIQGIWSKRRFHPKAILSR